MYAKTLSAGFLGGVNGGFLDPEETPKRMERALEKLGFTGVVMMLPVISGDFFALSKLVFDELNQTVIMTTRSDIK